MITIEDYSRTHSEIWALLETKAPLARPPWALILAEVSLQTGVSVADMKGPRKFRYMARARQLYYWRAHMAGIPFAQIGRGCGDRDHTTVMSGIKVIEAVRRGEKKPIYDAELQ